MRRVKIRCKGRIIMDPLFTHQMMNTHSGPVVPAAQSDDAQNHQKIVWVLLFQEHINKTPSHTVISRTQNVDKVVGHAFWVKAGL